jgi:hypothetical protein
VGHRASGRARLCVRFESLRGESRARRGGRVHSGSRNQ